MKAGVFEIIVLHTTRYGEKDLIVHALSADHGRCGLIVRNVGRGRKSASLFQPLNCLEVEAVEGNGGLMLLKDASLSNMLMSVRTDIVKSSMAIFMCEVLYRFVRTEVMEAGIYEWLRSTLAVFESLDEGYANFHLYFLVDLCRVMGFAPSVQGYDESHRVFSINLAEFSHEGLVFSEGNSLCLYRCLTMSFAEFMAMPANRDLRKSFAEDMLKYLCYHTESSVEIKSLDVLHDILC